VLLQSPDTELVVVSAAHLEPARRLAERLGCEAAEGWEPVVARDDLDAVIVATPPHLHAITATTPLFSRHGSGLRRDVSESLSSSAPATGSAGDRATSESGGLITRCPPSRATSRTGPASAS
jgi:hypothetical protein